MDYTTIISIQIILQRITLKEIDRAKLITYIARNKIDKDTMLYELQTQSLVAEQDLIGKLINEDIWEEV